MAAPCRLPSDPPDLNSNVDLQSSFDHLPLAQSSDCAEQLSSRSVLKVFKDRSDSLIPSTLPASSSDFKGMGLLDPLSPAFRSKDINLTNDLPVSSNLIFSTLDRDVLVTRDSSSKSSNPTIESVNRIDTVSLEDKHVEESKNLKYSFIDAWSRPQRIKINFDPNSTVMSSDGIAVRLNTDQEITNSRTLPNSILLKVLGKNIPLSICSIELRKHWNRFGNFHLTSLGMNWILCSFKTVTAMDEVLSGGPWYIGGHIVGLDKWSPSFSPLSLKGLSAPVWIRFPHLPLHCWDEINIAMIASRIATGTSMASTINDIHEEALLAQQEDYGPWMHVKFKKRSRPIRNHVASLRLVEKATETLGNASLPNSDLLVPNDTDENLIINKVINSPHHQTITTGTKLHLSNSSDILDDTIEIANRAIPPQHQKTTSVAELHMSNSFGILDDISKSNTEEKSGMHFNSDVDNAADGKTVNCLDKLHSISPICTLAAEQITGFIIESNHLETLVCSGVDQDCSDSLNQVSTDFPIESSEGFVEIPMDSNTEAQNLKSVVFGALTTPSKGVWHVAMVYGHKDFQIRRELWNCLDKVMTSKMVPSASVKHLARIASDHCPVAFKLDDTMHSHSKTFRFEDTWCSYPATKGIVTKAWNKHDYGDDSEVLNRRIKRTLKSLFFWNRNKCKSLNKLKEELKNDILKLQLQEEVEGGLSPEDLDTLCNKVRELNVTLTRLSTWWNQHAKAKWNEEGDINFRYYHAYATARKNGKLIRQIKNEKNTIVEEIDEIESIFLKFS
ncbi:hypothetical protein KFK09_017687 [Dendrobium nobile]|uniref:DUF4283 domain-containing protein n=1 Tax=Dendrobium nobile TaxID=94219 RepID=A0A8T3ASQ6_DENNO|nr:hypothetical protein KFK09_017687 [Dendrobium nobile]